METLTLIKPDDMHVHLRQGEFLPEYTRQTARYFKRAIVMPNVLPPITDVSGLEQYKAQIIDAAPGFQPLMTFKITRDLKPADIPGFKKAGAVAGKYYPAGVTTNSEDGITDWTQMIPVLDVMEQEGLVLSIHGEMPGKTILKQEEEFLPVVEDIIRKYSRLKVVLEHISTRAAVQRLKQWPDNAAATLTVHHLLYTLDDLMGTRMNPHLFCKPVVKTPEDRAALQEFVLEDFPRLFFGSDSAPHSLDTKLSAAAPPGLFSAPAALPLLADFFEKEGQLGKLEPFVSQRGADFYGLPRNSETIILKRVEQTVPDLVGEARPLCGGSRLSWSI